MVMLTVAAFFLSENGRINNFPTYATGLLFLLLIVLDRSVVRHFNWQLLGLPFSPIYLILPRAIFLSHLEHFRIWIDGN